MGAGANEQQYGTVLPAQQGGAGRATTQGGLGALQQSQAAGIAESAQSGFLNNIVPQFQAMSQAANFDFNRRQAQLRERAGSLGNRFSSQLGQAEGELARDTSLGVLQQMMPSFNQATEGAANRRQNAIFQGIPGIMGAAGGAAQADIAARQGANQLPLGFGGQFAPVGTNSRSNAFNAQLGIK